jgi:dipeptide/tripeptide permease
MIVLALWLAISTAYLGLTVITIMYSQWCMCGKSKPAVLLWSVHPKLSFMVLSALISTSGLLVSCATNERPPSFESLFTAIWVLAAILDWLQVYYHEKDKLKKKLKKALGRVVVLDNGRLGVTNT